MPRIASIDQLLFPVAVRPLFSEVEIDGTRKRLNLDRYRLLVNIATNTPLGVVSRDYRVITNQEAVELGKKCCRELLGLGTHEPLEIFAVDAPSTGSYCHIDIVHRGSAMNLWRSVDKAEVYVPYVRVTNSYNRTRALRFDVGFCRELCQNGVIFEQETIRFTYSHLRRELSSDDIRFDVTRDQFAKLSEDFRAFVDTAKSIAVPADMACGVVGRVLALPDEESAERQRSPAIQREMLEVVGQWQRIVARYIVDMGPNAYALFNAMTDIASHIMQSRAFPKDRNAMQKTAGVWLHEVHRRAKKSPIDWKDLLPKEGGSKKKSGRFASESAVA